MIVRLVFSGFKGELVLINFILVVPQLDTYSHCSSLIFVFQNCQTLFVCTVQS